MTGFQYSTASTILLYSVLIFLSLIEVQAQNKDKQALNCSSSCGEIQNISYPFRLKGDPSGCGDTDYELSCVNNKTILQVFPGKYYVKNISYDDQILRLVDVNFANGSCSLPSGSIEGGGYIRDFRFKGGVTNLRSRFRFVKCSTNISQDGYTPVPCLTTNRTYFYTKYDGDYFSSDLERSCSLVSVASVDLDHKVNVTKLEYSNEAVMELLQAGFDVGWSLVCRDCSLSGKACVWEKEPKPLNYICQRDADYKHFTRSHVILIFLAMAVGGLIFLVVIIVTLVFVIRKYRGRKSQNAADSTQENMQTSTNY